MAQYNSIPSTLPSFGSKEINGQLVPVFMGSGFVDVGNATGPTYLGYGVNTPATIPLTAGAQSTGAQPALGGSMLQLTPRTAFVLVIMLVVGVLGLRYIHWRG